MGRSLRLRLILAALASIVVALVIAGIGIATIFERHVIRRVEAELDAHLKLLAGEVAFGVDGVLALAREPSDPRFNDPLGGLYWQVSEDRDGASLRSRSLWDHVLELPPRTGPPGAVALHDIAGRGGARLLVGERLVGYAVDGATRPVRIAVAIDRSDIVKAREEFTSDAMQSLVLLAFVLMVAAWMQIAVGLQPLEAVRRSVNRVRSGRQPRIAVDEPSEVMPLVAEVNSLLDAQDKAIEQARRRAADLAHGLKSPLQVLAMDAERLRSRGEAQLADEIEELAEGMRRHIGRELSRVRLQPRSAAATLRTPVGPVVEQLVRTLARSPMGQALHFDIAIPTVTVAAIPLEDLTELIGNLLDNAVKWATSEVHVRAETGPGLALVIEDDGPGVSPELLASLGERGVRLDETVEGTGLGLAIASDIVEAYGARLAFGNRDQGGFRVTLTQPAQAAV